MKIELVYGRVKQDEWQLSSKRVNFSFNELFRNGQEQAVAVVTLTEIDAHNCLLISGFSTHTFMPMS